MVRKDSIDKEFFEQRPHSSEETSYVALWRQSVPETETSHCKSPDMGVGLVAEMQ